MNSQADIKQLVRLQLLATAALTARVGVSVLTAHPRTVDPNEIPMPCVIVDITGGKGQYSGGSQSAMVDLYIYTRDSDTDADALYKIAYDALNMVHLVNRTTSNGVPVVTAAGYIYEVDRPVTGYNDQAQAWYARGKWRAQVAG